MNETNKIAIELVAALESLDIPEHYKLLSKVQGIMLQLVGQNQHLAPYRTAYEEAMVASNEAGYAGISAADTIRDMDKTIRDLYTQLDRGTE